MIGQIAILIMIPLIVFSIHGLLSYEDFELSIIKDDANPIIAVCAKNIRVFLTVNSIFYILAFGLFEFTSNEKLSAGFLVLGFTLTLFDMGLVRANSAR